MASRNLNFPHTYGTGVVLIPFRFEIEALAGGTDARVRPGTMYPPEGFSVRPLIVSDVFAFQLFVYTVDRFTEGFGQVLNSSMQVGSDDPEFWPQFTGNGWQSDGTQQVSMSSYRRVAGVDTKEWFDCKVNGLYIMRNSSAKY